MMVMLSHGLVSGALFLCVGRDLRPAAHPRDRPLRRPRRSTCRSMRCSSCCSRWPRSACPGTSGFVGEFLRAGRHLSGVELGRRSSAPPASSSARPTCSTSTAGSPSACRSNADAAAMPDLGLREWRCSVPIAARGAVDGRLSRELPRADARGHRRARRATRAGRGRRATRKLDDRPPKPSAIRRWRARGRALMDFAHSLRLIVPEICCRVAGARAAAGRRLGRRQGGRADQRGRRCALLAAAASSSPSALRAARWGRDRRLRRASTAPMPSPASPSC